MIEGQREMVGQVWVRSKRGVCGNKVEGGLVGGSSEFDVGEVG